MVHVLYAVMPFTFHNQQPVSSNSVSAPPVGSNLTYLRAEPVNLWSDKLKRPY